MIVMTKFISYLHFLKTHWPTQDDIFSATRHGWKKCSRNDGRGKTTGTAVVHRISIPTSNYSLGALFILEIHSIIRNDPYKILNFTMFSQNSNILWFSSKAKRKIAITAPSRPQIISQFRLSTDSFIKYFTSRHYLQ